MPRKSKSPKKSIETLARELLNKKSKPRKVISSLPPGKGSPMKPKRVKSSSPKKAKRVKSTSPKKPKRVKSISPESKRVKSTSPKKSIETLAREILDKKSKPRKVISSLPLGKSSPKKPKRVKSTSPESKRVKSTSPESKRVKSTSPRRLSGYLLFSKEKRAGLEEQTKKELGPKRVISMIAEEWRKLSPDERDQYNSKAKGQFIQTKSPKAKRVQEKLPLPQGFEPKEAVIVKKRGRPKKQKSQLDILD